MYVMIGPFDLNERTANEDFFKTKKVILSYLATMLFTDINLKHFPCENTTNLISSKIFRENRLNQRAIGLCEFYRYVWQKVVMFNFAGVELMQKKKKIDNLKRINR